MIWGNLKREAIGNRREDLVPGCTSIGCFVELAHELTGRWCGRGGGFRGSWSDRAEGATTEHSHELVNDSGVGWINNIGNWLFMQFLSNLLINDFPSLSLIRAANNII